MSKKKRNIMTDEEFSEFGGRKCPLCGSENLASEPSAEVGDNSAFATTRDKCRECGGKWACIYKVVGWDVDD